MMCRFALMGLLVVATMSVVAAPAAGPSVATGKWKEGKSYTRINPPIPLPGNKKIMVAEFFGYWSALAKDMEPKLDPWSKRPPGDVTVMRFPLVLPKKPLTYSYARMYYTLQTLGRLDLHRRFYEAIAQSNADGYLVMKTFAEQQTFAAENGVPAPILQRYIIPRRWLEKSTGPLPAR